MLLGVVDHFLFGLLEVELPAFESMPQMLSKSHVWFYLVTGVLFNHLDNGGHHLFLIVGHTPKVCGLVCKLAVVGIALGEISIEPDFDLAVAVDANHIFGGFEIADPEEDLFKTIEGTEEDVQILGVGDILDVTESDRNVLDVYFGVVVRVAELFDLLRVYKL